MKKLLLLLTMLVIGIGSMWAIDVKLATYNQPINTLVSATGTGTSTSLSSLAFSGLAGLTITAPNTDVTLGPNNAEGYVNATYGYCLSIVTSDVSAHTVQLSAPSGYKIIGYSLFARSNTSSRNHTITPAAGGDAITSTTSGVWLKVSGILLAETSFTIQTGGDGNTCYIPYFTVSLVADSKKVKDKALTVGDAVTFSGIDAIADGTTPVLLYNNGRGTYVFDNPYTNRLGSCSASDGKVNTSAAKFLIKKSDNKYIIQNYDSKKYIPANATTTQEVFANNAAQFTIIDNGNGTYGIQDAGNHSFNGNPAGYEGFCYWGSGTTDNSAYKIMKISSEEDLEYTIADAFYNTTGYYRIKVAGRGSWYMSASGSDTYMRLVTTAFDHSGAQVWKITSASNGVNLYSEGVDKYVTCNAHSAVGSSLNSFTNSSEAACNFIPEDKGSSNYGFLTYAPIKTYLSNNGGTGNGSMGYYTTYDAGAQLQFERVYRVILKSEIDEILGYIYSNGNITASDLHDYDYYISGVAKTKSEVATAINAVTEDDNLVIVCARHRSATISSKAEIDPTKVYSLTTARGWLYAKNADNTVKTTVSSGTYTTFDENNQWAFVTVNEGDTYYLYNVGKKRFLMSRFGTGNFMDDKFTIRPVTINTTGNATYPLSFKDGSSTYNVSGDYLLIDSWSTPDDGNRYSVQAIEDIVFDPSEAQAMLNAMSSNIPFITSPAPSAGSFDAATTWYFLSMRPNDGNGGYYAYVPENYDYTSPTNIPLGTSTGTKLVEDKYLWCVTGSMADGYRLFNKAAGADKVFVFDDGGKMKACSGNESASLFYLAKANVPSAMAAPTFVFSGTESRPNRQSNAIATWSTSDTGSEFSFESFDDYIHDVLTSNYSPYFTLSGYVYGLNWDDAFFTSDLATQYTTVYATPTVEGYTTFVSNFEAAAKVQPVENAKYHIISAYPNYEEQQGVKKALYYDTDAAIFKWKTYDSSDEAFTFQLRKTGDNWNIYNPRAGKYLKDCQGSDNASDDASTFTFTDLGIAQLNISDGTDKMHTDGHSSGAGVSGTITRWDGGLNTASAWYIAPVIESVSAIEPNAVAEDADVYQTFANPYDCQIANAEVYYITTQTTSTAHIEQADNNYVPAGTGVVLKAKKAATISIRPISGDNDENLTNGTNSLVAGDGSKTIAAGNYMLAYSSSDDIAKFYAIGTSGYVVPANKAYLRAAAVGARSLILSFDNDATGIQSLDDESNAADNVIYNVTGQRISKMQRGINIVNGKKIFVK